MKATRFVTFGVTLIMVLLMVGGLASQVSIVAEAFGPHAARHAVPVIQKAMTDRDVTVQTMDRIMVVACRDHVTPDVLTSKKNAAN